MASLMLRRLPHRCQVLVVAHLVKAGAPHRTNDLDKVGRNAREDGGGEGVAAPQLTLPH